MTEKSYDDPVKAMVREKFADFIRRTIMQYKKPRDIYVVCFPGAEALEIYEVYDKLGIPRKNILGLEKYPGPHRALQEQNLGIRLTDKPMDDRKFFETTPLKFDVISLDYQGQQKGNELETLENIAGRQILQNRGVLFTNYCGKREQNDLQARLYLKDLLIESMNEYGKEAESDFRCNPFDHPKDFTLSDALSMVLKIDQMAGKDLDDFSSSMKQKMNGVGFELDNYRDKSITNEVIIIFEKGKRNISLLPQLKNWSLNEYIRKIIYDNIDNPVYRLREKLYKNSTEKLLNNPTYSGSILLYRIGLSFYVSDRLKKMGVKEELLDSLSYILTTLFLHSEQKPYFPISNERYSYISNSRTPMISDLFFFDQKKEFFRKYSDLIDIDFIDEYTAKITINAMGKFKDLNKAFNEVKKRVPSYLGYELPERIFLGSSYNLGNRKIFRKQKPTEKLSKEDAISLLQDNIPIDEIIEAFTESFTKGQLSAFKAHLTMGTYSKKD